MQLLKIYCGFTVYSEKNLNNLKDIAVLNICYFKIN